MQTYDALVEVKERRASPRLALEAAVTVRAFRGRRELFASAGTLQVISASGALLRMGRQLAPGDRVNLHVHFDHPASGRVEISFPAEVVRVERLAEWRVAVRFRGGHRFLLAEAEPVKLAHV